MDSLSKASIPSESGHAALMDFLAPNRAKLEDCLQEAVASFAELYAAVDGHKELSSLVRKEDIKEIVTSQTTALCKDILQAADSAFQSAYELMIELAFETDNQRELLYKSAAPDKCKLLMRGLMEQAEQHREARKQLLARRIDRLHDRQLQGIREQVTVQLDELMEIGESVSAKKPATDDRELTQIQEQITICSVDTSLQESTWYTAPGKKKHLSEDQLSMYRNASLAANISKVQLPPNFKVVSFSKFYKIGHLCCVQKQANPQNPGQQGPHGAQLPAQPVRYQPYNNPGQANINHSYEVGEFDIEANSYTKLFDIDFPVLEFLTYKNLIIVVDKTLIRVRIYEGSNIVHALEVDFDRYNQSQAMPFKPIAIQKNYLFFWCINGEFMKMDLENKFSTELLYMKTKLRGFGFIGDHFVQLDELGWISFFDLENNNLSSRHIHKFTPEQEETLGEKGTVNYYNMYADHDVIITFWKYSRPAQLPNTQLTALVMRGGKLVAISGFEIPHELPASNIETLRPFDLLGIRHLMMMARATPFNMFMICIEHDRLFLKKIVKMVDEKVHKVAQGEKFCLEPVAGGRILMSHPNKPYLCVTEFKLNGV